MILQQLKTIKGLETYYWTNDRGGAEIDFVVDNGSAVIPIEVKAETNLKAKSLKMYQESFSPNYRSAPPWLITGVRFDC